MPIILQSLKKILTVDSEKFYKAGKFTHTHALAHTHTHTHTHTHAHTYINIEIHIDKPTVTNLSTEK